MSIDVYVVGAGGQLGRALLATVPDHPDLRQVKALTSTDCDVTDVDSVNAALDELRTGDVVINCAAYTDVDGAETDQLAAERINAEGPGHLARRTAQAGAWLIHVSTDYVYPGDASSPYEPADADTSIPPATVYGRTKLAGERAALEADPRTTVVRTAWVYTGGPDSADFVATMRRLEGAGRTVSVVDDQTGSPTYALDLATALWDLVVAGPGDERVGRVLHATNEGAVSWYEVARAVFEAVGADPDRVSACTTAEFPRPAPRPAYSVLSGASWNAAGLQALRPWRQALVEAIEASPA